MNSPSWATVRRYLLAPLAPSQASVGRLPPDQDVEINMHFYLQSQASAWVPVASLTTFPSNSTTTPLLTPAIGRLLPFFQLLYVFVQQTLMVLPAPILLPHSKGLRRMTAKTPKMHRRVATHLACHRHSPANCYRWVPPTRLFLWRHLRTRYRYATASTLCFWLY